MDKAKILEKIRNGDASVMDYLFETYYEKLYFFAEKIIYDSDAANDVVQNVFLRIWKNGGNIDIRSSIKPYLFTAVKNECLQHLKGIKVRDDNNGKWLSAYVESLNLDALETDNELNFAKIMQCMEDLPDQCRRVFEYRSLYGYKYSVIASIMNISESVVKVQMYRAYKKIKEKLLSGP